MPVRFLSEAQREHLSAFPAELDPAALDRFFTLSAADLAEARGRRGDGNRLGWALQLCGLRMLGFCPDDVATAPASGVNFLARQLGVDPHALATYGERGPDPHRSRQPGEGPSGLPVGLGRRIWRRSGSGRRPRRWCRTARSCCSTWRASASTSFV